MPREVDPDHLLDVAGLPEGLVAGVGHAAGGLEVVVVGAVGHGPAAGHDHALEVDVHAAAARRVPGRANAVEALREADVVVQAAAAVNGSDPRGASLA